MGNTNSLPEIGFIRLPQLLTLIPFAKSTLWLKVRQGVFPAPVKLSQRVTAWSVRDIRAYIDGLTPNPNEKKQEEAKDGDN
jgi:prophage regulatory protein